MSLPAGQNPGVADSRQRTPQIPITESVIPLSGSRNIGRPVEYNEELLLKAHAYLDTCKDLRSGKKTKNQRATDRLKVNLPTKGGLAVFLGVHRDTLYDWSKKYPEFSYIMERLGAEQEDRLINFGLSGDYNSTITKVLLTKHGYREGLDQTSNGRELPVPILSALSSVER